MTKLPMWDLLIEVFSFSEDDVIFNLWRHNRKLPDNVAVIQSTQKVCFAQNFLVVFHVTFKRHSFYRINLVFDISIDDFDNDAKTTRANNFNNVESVCLFGKLGQVFFAWRGLKWGCDDVIKSNYDVITLDYLFTFWLWCHEPL